MEVKKGSNVVQQNEYDGLGRRIVRSVYSPPGTLSHRIHNYYNEQWQLLEERKEVSGTEDPDPLNQYVWHPYYVDALAVRYYDASSGGSQVQQYYLQDANYNVTAVLNASGAVLERYLYSPYGQVTYCNGSFAVQFSQSTSAIGNTHLYTGRERDPETGLQLNRFRYYDPPLGRWTTRDPSDYLEDSNLYGYVGEAPTVYIDPSGLDRELVARAFYHHFFRVVINGQCYELHYSLIGSVILPCPPGGGMGKGNVRCRITSTPIQDLRLFNQWTNPGCSIYIPFLHDCNTVAVFYQDYGIPRVPCCRNNDTMLGQ